MNYGLYIQWNAIQHENKPSIITCNNIDPSHKHNFEKMSPDTQKYFMIPLT